MGWSTQHAKEMQLNNPCTQEQARYKSFPGQSQGRSPLVWVARGGREVGWQFLSSQCCAPKQHLAARVACVAGGLPDSFVGGVCS